MSRHFNSKLLNYTQRFSSISGYLFYAQSILQQMNFRNQISIAMRKMSSLDLNASMFQNYKKLVQMFVKNNQDFIAMNQIRGTFTYWKKCQTKILAMLKQLDCLTFFLNHSCVDLRWNELLGTIAKLKNMNIS